MASKPNTNHKVNIETFPPKAGLNTIVSVVYIVNEVQYEEIGGVDTWSNLAEDLAMPIPDGVNIEGGSVSIYRETEEGKHAQFPEGKSVGVYFSDRDTRSKIQLRDDVIAIGENQGFSIDDQPLALTLSKNDLSFLYESHLLTTLNGVKVSTRL